MELIAPDEVFVDCPGYLGYKVSNYGRVWSDVSNRMMKICTRDKAPRDYPCIGFYRNKKTAVVYVHRLVATAFLPNPQNKPMVDHIDGVVSNNHVSNLRWATDAENHHNARGRGGRSRYKGVYWHAGAKKWHAQITIDSQVLYVGLFDDETDAARAYDAAAREHHGEFARLNFP